MPLVNMKILKFGGTSVGTSDSIHALLNIVKEAHAKGEGPLVVLSAMGGVTNQLNQLALDAQNGEDVSGGIAAIENRHFQVIRDLIPIKQQNPVFTQVRLLVNELDQVLTGIRSLGELSIRSQDLVLGFGERLSAYLVSQVAAQYLPQPRFIDARDIICTNSQFGHAQVQLPQSEINIRETVNQYPDATLFVTGFIASDAQGRSTTLGRGGSDYTAALFASVLDAAVIEIWTDVDGMLTADPRMVKKARYMKDLSYAEAMELSYFGAKVIYPPTMVPAFQKKIPIVIRNTFNPNFEGTTIQHQASPSSFPIRGISSISDISLVNITGSGMVGKSGFSGRLFSLLARERINIILITQSSSEHSITFAVQPQDLLKTRELLESEFELEFETHKLVPPEIEEDLSVLAVVGENMKATPGMSGKLFQALGRSGINVRAIAQGSSELNISVIVRKSDLSRALNAVHDAFFDQLNKTLNLFVVGMGNIGAAFLDQLKKQQDRLQNEHDLDIRLIGLTNSRQLLIQPEGIPLENWQQVLDQQATEADLERFMEQMKALHLPDSVLVDNTASSVLPHFYEGIFEAGISIVTCNKIANSGPYSQYELLKNTARENGVSFFYETNVGAGLPIIRVLKDLVLTGDRVLKLEAILSGTISYIFNTYQGERTFHDVVHEAQSLGYTEPDPRDDLSGSDFVRKMLILAREAGYSVEANDVYLDPILPQNCLEAATVEEFYQELSQSENYFAELKSRAAVAGKVLRYIGVLEDGQLKISLESVAADHPFFTLSGSDNIISFTTERYRDQSLVVRGPGAGAAVTAAGVFADLLQVCTR